MTARRSRVATALVLLSLAASSVGVSTRPVTAGAAAGTELVPSRVVRALRSSTDFVVVTRVYPKSATPRACNPGPCLDLLRTTDNGARFTRLHLPPIGYVKGDDTGNLDQVVFANARFGYVVLSTTYPSILYVTVDGAKTWHRSTIASRAEIFALVPTRDELYAVLARCSTTIGCSDFRIARSAVDGAAWSIHTLRDWPRYSGAGLAAYASRVWLSQQPPGTAELLTSNDKGRNFHGSSQPKLGSINGCALTAMSASDLWAECPTGMEVSFFFSGDGGVRWNRIPSNQFMGTGGGYFDPVSSGLAYLDSGAPTTSTAKNFYRVTNSGRTVVAVGRLACDDLTSLVFTDERHGLATCDQLTTSAGSTLWGTSDGGATWRRVRL